MKSIATVVLIATIMMPAVALAQMPIPIYYPSYSQKSYERVKYYSADRTPKKVDSALINHVKQLHEAIAAYEGKENERQIIDSDSQSMRLHHLMAISLQTKKIDSQARAGKSKIMPIIKLENNLSAFDSVVSKYASYVKQDTVKEDTTLQQKLRMIDSLATALNNAVQKQTTQAGTETIPLDKVEVMIAAYQHQATTEMATGAMIDAVANLNPPYDAKLAEAFDTLFQHAAQGDTASMVGLDTFFNKNQQASFDTLDADLKIVEQPDSMRVSIIGIGGASAVNGLSQSTAGVNFGLKIDFGKHYNVDPGYRLYNRNTFYLLFNPLKASSNDSSSLAKTYLFPEISARDFVLGYERRFPFSWRGDMNSGNNTFRNATFSAFCELATSHYDTGSIEFRTWDALLGMKFNFSSTISNLNFGFQIIPYYSLVSVMPKDFFGMDSALLGVNMNHLADSIAVNGKNVANNYKGVPPTNHSIGLEVRANLSSFSIFANVKYCLNSSVYNNPLILTRSADLQGAAFTVGVIISPEIWSFNVPYNK